MTDDIIDYKHISRSLLEAIPLPIFIVERNLTIFQYNQRTLHLLGLSQDLQGQPFAEFIRDPAILQLVKESIRNESQQKARYEKSGSDTIWKISVAPLSHRTDLAATLRLSAPTSPPPAIAPDATPVAAQASNESVAIGEVQQPLVANATVETEDDNGALSSYRYFAVIIEDLTEAHRLERMQRDFLANISHELRTPLTSVRLLAETLEDVIDTNPERAQTFVEKIETEVQYLSELVAELLELSRLESGQTMMTIEPIEAERLVREVMARMLPLAQRYRVQLGTDIQQGCTLVAADSKQITRVLVNLVHNAIKFTPSGGKITIGTAPQAQHPVQRFTVKDTGVGIRAEELPRIFERFYKTDRARSKAGYIGPGGGGTGLGLAIARHVVETHGGRITAESVVGQGSTFTFTLPIAVRGNTVGSE